MCYYNEYGEEVTELEIEEQFCDMLDEVYGDVDIAGCTFSAGLALRELDPIAYRCAFNDWVDSQIEDQLLFEEQTVDAGGE